MYGDAIGDRALAVGPGATCLPRDLRSRPRRELPAHHYQAVPGTPGGDPKERSPWGSPRLRATTTEVLRGDG